jgi:rod shape-determining protein MreD
MVRAALTSRRRIGEGPVAFATSVPAATVVAASLLAALPIVSTSGWVPDFGFMVLLGWRLLRSEPFPHWWAAPLGLVNDLFTGLPIGLSVALWSATILALDLIDRRTMWRDYWIEWGLAALFLFMHEWLEWQIAAVTGARLPFSWVVAPLLVAIFSFPIVAWIVSRIDRWRLGR